MIEVGLEVLKVPTGNGQGTLTLDMREVRHIENRKMEVASVTKMKAPELMSAMEKGYSLVAQSLLPKVTFELDVARQLTEERKAVVMLDEAPRILQEKGLATSRSPGGSADQRESILALDKEYQQKKNIVSMLEAVQSVLKSKLRGFEMSYQSVKKVFDSLDGRNGMDTAAHRDLSSGIPDEVSPGDEVLENIFNNRG